MKKIILTTLVLCPLYAQAEILKTSLYSIESIDDSQLMVRFTNGRIAYVPKEAGALKMKLSRIEENELIEATLDKNYSLTEINSRGFKRRNDLTSTASSAFYSPEFSPTVLSSPSMAATMFSRLNSDYGRSSECSNRAHVWAYEEDKNHGIKSEKVYVLFTASYINRFRFKWWFHVAPLVSVKIGNSVEKFVLDYMFGRQPVTIKEWTDQFVFSRRACKETTHFSEYDVNPQTEDCYLMTDSMYTWTPYDLRDQERGQQAKTDFSRGEIWSAYQQAF